MKIKNAEFYNDRMILHKKKKDIEILFDNIKEKHQFDKGFQKMGE
jgi:hypothetical protein